MANIRHQMIMASAGAGKTYELGARFIRLLCLGVPPGRIIALTFTRKAALEFLDVIFKRLTEACGSDDAARALSLDPSSTGKDSPIGLLRLLTQELNHLNLTTLDSFFARVVRCLRFEAELEGEISLIDPLDQTLVREEAMRLLLHRAPPELKDGFLKAFRRAHVGSSEKSLERTFNRFVDEFHQHFLEFPDASAWGRPDSIWSGEESCPLLPPPPSIDQALGVLRLAVMSLSPSDRLETRWMDFLNDAENWRPGTPLPQSMEYLLDRYVAARENRAEPNPQVTLSLERRKIDLSPDVSSALDTIIQMWAGTEIERALTRTEGIYGLIRLYELLYDRTVRRSGQIAFQDLPYLVRQGLTSTVGAARTTFRMDGQFDHWLLDEFQDTARNQWEALEPIASEILMDASGRRSFFFVGDLKQAIYGWRGGDAELFREILERYAGEEQGIETVERTRTYRCAPAIVECVNAVFGHRRAIAQIAGERVAGKWAANFQAHSAARPQPVGHVAVVPCADEEEKLQLLFRLIEALDPVSRAESCAVLVSSNKAALETAQALRSAGLPVRLESPSKPGVDNQIGRFVSALLRAAFYPEDELARQYLRHTPWGQASTDAPGFAARLETIRADINSLGLAPVLRAVLRFEGIAIAHAGFNGHCRDKVVELARDFDRRGEIHIARFLQRLERDEQREESVGGQVLVMTVHQSKGLGFDHVLLPDLRESRSFREARNDVWTHRASTEQAWVLQPPSKRVCRLDPTLREFQEKAEDEAAYENLCRAYVAMTRARRSLYALVLTPEKRSSALNTGRLLVQALGISHQEFSLGHPPTPFPAIRSFGAVWQPEAEQAAAPEKPPRPPAPATHTVQPLPAFATLVRRLPSSTAQEDPAGPVVSLEQQRRMDLGTLVHSVLAQSPRSDEWEPILRLAAQPLRDPRLTSEASGILHAAYADPAFAGLFDQDRSGREVWTERAFEAMLHRQWISGVFDRVEMATNPAGETSILLVDYKCTRFTGQTHHLEQVHTYREVLQHMFDLGPEQIEARLIYLDPLKIIDLPLAQDRGSPG